MAKQYDFVAIGDIVMDAFIRLQIADEHMDKETREICMPFATKIPFEFVVEIPAVGNCANAAVAAARLGLTSALVTNQGNDETGAKNLKALETEHVATDFVKVHEGKKSNYHYVLWYKDERTILVKHEEYPYEMPDVEAKWLYLTSLSATSAEFHDKIADYLDKYPETKLAFQPGTFQIKLGKERLKRLYEHSDIFFCNVQEAQQILGSTESDIKKLLEQVHALGPKFVVITDGPTGAYARDPSTALGAGEATYWFQPPYPDVVAPYDRTGAGDAFASTFTIAIEMGKSVPEALSWAPINSMSVVQKVGAREGLLTKQQLEEYLSKAPAEYKAKRI